MKGGSVAKRYASALLKVAQETNSLDPIQKDLTRLVNEIAAHKDLRLALESPVVAISNKQALFAAIQQQLGLCNAVKNLMQILIDQDRVMIVPVLGLLFRDMADAALGQVRVQVKTATPIGDQEAKLKSILANALGQKILLESRVDPELLGGLWVQVGDRVFDASLKRGLAKLKEVIVKKAVA